MQGTGAAPSISHGALIERISRQPTFNIRQDRRLRDISYRSSLGSQRLIPGNAVSRMVTRVRTTMYGTTAREIFSSETLAMPIATKRLTPSGGVRNPISEVM